MNPRVEDLVRFIKARENAKLAKEGLAHKPLDPIIAKYRFCNVHREDDYVTRWLRDNWYSNFAGDPDVWFAAIVARLFNLPESLTDLLECTLPFKPEFARKMLHGRKIQKLKNFNAAYIVSTNGIAMDKVDYVVQRVLGPLWAARKMLRIPHDTLKSLHEHLMQFDGMGSFLAAQVVADLKYMPPFNEVVDWWSFASSGPGSRRGLNRIMNRAPDAAQTERNWKNELDALHIGVNAKLMKQGWEELHAQDLQNCLCEFDKYERVRLGEGTPKQLYKPRGEEA